MGLHCLLLPLAVAAFSLSINSFIISCNASFRLVSSNTSSVVTVERPACFAKFSRSWATVSAIQSAISAVPIRRFGGCHIPVCAQTISVKAPMNCAVAFTPRRRDSASTILPMENHKAALRRCGGVSKSTGTTERLKVCVLPRASPRPYFQP